MAKALTPDQAERIISERIGTTPPETCALAQGVGRILRQDVLAERDNPPFDRVCMDGVAVASSEFATGTRRFRVQATQAAGALPLRLESGATAIEVMTGAVLPHGTDCVIPLEEYDLTAGTLQLKADASAAQWRNVQRRGADSQPGAIMLRTGTTLGAAEIAIAASAGLAQIEVARQPRIMVVSTGDELVDPGMPIEGHQVRRSNAYGVVAAFHAHGYAHVGNDHLRDDEQLMRRRLAEHLDRNDVIVLSGGVSKGKFDFVPAALKALGVEEQFYQVAQRPGRPLWFGTGARGQAVFGLPGNPVSTLVCLTRYVLPALRAAMGATDSRMERVALGETLEAARSLTFFMPVKLQSDERARTSATPVAPNGSGDFLALSGTQGFVELPPSETGHPEGFVARLYRW